MKRSLFAAALFLALAPTMALRAAETPPACDGEIWALRKSEIIPGGTLDGFMKAVSDNNAWYRNHGYKTNEQHGGRVMVVDREAHTATLSPNIVMTVHVNVPKDDKLPRNDAAWTAFVAEYKANAKIVDETWVCMPAAK